MYRFCRYWMMLAQFEFHKNSEQLEPSTWLRWSLTCLSFFFFHDISSGEACPGGWWHVLLHRRWCMPAPYSVTTCARQCSLHMAAFRLRNAIYIDRDNNIYSLFRWTHETKLFSFIFFVFHCPNAIVFVSALPSRRCNGSLRVFMALKRGDAWWVCPTSWKICRAHDQVWWPRETWVLEPHGNLLL